MKLICSVKTVLLGAALSFLQSSVSAKDFEGDSFNVMTRNVYVGADLDPVLAGLQYFIATNDPTQLNVAMEAAATQGITSNNNLRMQNIAKEIAENEAIVVGIQEAFTWVLNGAVVADATELILEYLRDDWELEYKVVVTKEPDVFVLPGGGALTSGDVLLVKDSDDIIVNNAMTELFNAQFAVTAPDPIGESGFTRGFVAADINLPSCHKFRTVSTHLEAVSPPLVPVNIRALQALELLENPIVNTGLPVILMGDFNSQVSEMDDSAAIILRAGFTDAWTMGEAEGYTYGHDGNLSDIEKMFDQRIDFVTVEGNLEVLDAKTTDTLISADVRPLWPSDHKGVVATIKCRN